MTSIDAEIPAETPDYIGTATFSPEDNSLRIYPYARLPEDIYKRVRDAGFTWAPRQELFVAKAWTPERFDLLIELCGEVGDEDTSLVERAEERADRFGGYSDNRMRDANAARDAVEAISERFAGGQPILRGHHSERRARKDKERIDSGMQKAVKMWDTAKYWQERAAGAIRHAKYKERADVRARRIGKLEAERRKHERSRSDSMKLLKLWSSDKLSLALAKHICNVADHIHACFPLDQYPRPPEASKYEGLMSLWSALNDGIINETQARDIAIPRHERNIAYQQRWMDHLDLRLAYERTMLDEQGGLVADKVDIVEGGRVLIGREWLTVMRVTRKNGRVISIRSNAKYWNKHGIEEIRAYEPPTAEATAAVKAATKLPPLCNYDGPGFIQMTTEEWKQRSKVSDYAFARKIAATDNAGAHRARFIFGAGYTTTQVFITDAKIVGPPAPSAPKDEERPFAVVAPQPVLTSVPEVPKPRHETTEFDAMREQLKNGGVQVVVAPQLFPTPDHIVEQMVQLAEIQEGHVILEPSAGTGNILRQLRGIADGRTQRIAVEINPQLCSILRQVDPQATIVNGDFLDYASEARFDRIVMNPPFESAIDIEHIMHAMTLLKPGGRLVALCANGPRQNDRLRAVVAQHGGHWQVLPPDSFRDAGTAVNVAMLALTTPTETAASDQQLSLAI